MKFSLLFLPMVALSASLAAQPIVFDTLKNKTVLIGRVTQANIADSIWYKENYNVGIVTAGELGKVDKYSGNVSVEVYFGSWCDDSQYWVPAFIGLLDKTNMKSAVQLIALPGTKQSEETEKLEKIIERVPTFVFWRDGVEIGRIVESPEETLAKDIIKILKR